MGEPAIHYKVGTRLRGNCGSSIVRGMKFRLAASLVLITLFVAGVAVAQKPATPEKTDPLVLAQIATTIASNTQHQSFDGDLAIYVPPEKWAAGLKDSDLGPFLKFKEQKPGRSAVLIFPPSKGSAICVYFDGAAAFGITAAKADASGKIAASDISSGYKTVTGEMTKETGQEFHFKSGDINTDESEPLTAYQITSTSKKQSN